MKKNGFTMVEAVIVMIVITILSAIALVLIGNSVSGVRLNSAVDKVASDLRYASSMASGTAVWYGVSFEANPVNQYTIYTTTGTVDTTVENPAKFGSNFVVNVNSDYGASISSVNIAGGGKVEFNPLGAPYNDKTGALITAEGVVTLAGGTSTKTVRIVPRTGRIYVQ